MMPVSAPMFFVSIANAGVGAIPMLLTLVPHDTSPEIKAFCNIMLVVLVSRAVKTVLVLEWVAIPKPTRVARVGVRSTLARPRIPDVPNNLDKFYHIFSRSNMFVEQDVCRLRSR